jgi:hypothetical protein
VHLLASFITPPNALTNPVITSGIWDTNMYMSLSQTGSENLVYIKIYYVDSNGTSNKTLIKDGSSDTTAFKATSVNGIVLVENSLYVASQTLPDITKRIIIEVYVQQPTGNTTNHNITAYFRNGEQSHIHTGLVDIAVGATGPTGPTGPRSDTGPTGAAGVGYYPSNYVTQGVLAADATITSGSDNIVPFVAGYDPQSWWNNTLKRFQPTIPGYYYVTYGAWWATATTANGQTNIQTRFYDSSGVGQTTHIISQASLDVSNGRSLCGTKLIYLNGTTNYLEFTAYTSNSPNQTLQIGSTTSSGTWFSATLQMAGSLTGPTGPMAPVQTLNYNVTQGAQVTLNASSSPQTVMTSNSITTTGGPVQIIVNGDANPQVNGGWGVLQLYRGSNTSGTALGAKVNFESSAANENVPYSLSFIDNVGAGTYTYTLGANVITGGQAQFGESTGPLMTLVELASAIGPTGRTGPTGPIGTGPTGPTGPVSTVTGPTGPQGPPGAVTGSWTLSTGANTVSFTVPANNTYTMWVRGNIANGIVSWNATVTITNSNVPAVGTSYAWYYLAGNALQLTSIPTHIVGTANTIITTTVSTTTANTFSFGITNNSGSTQIVEYGYLKI